MACPRGEKQVTKHGTKIHGCFCEKKLGKAGKAFWWIKSGRSWVMITCPTKTKRGKCPVGTRGYVKLKPCR